MSFRDEWRGLFPVLTRTVGIVGVVAAVIFCRCIGVGLVNWITGNK